MTLPRSSGCTRTSRTLPRRSGLVATWTSSGYWTMPLTRCSRASSSTSGSAGRLACRGLRVLGLRGRAFGLGADVGGSGGLGLGSPRIGLGCYGLRRIGLRRGDRSLRCGGAGTGRGGLGLWLGGSLRCGGAGTGRGGLGLGLGLGGLGLGCGGLGFGVGGLGLGAAALGGAVPGGRLGVRALGVLAVPGGLLAAFLSGRLAGGLGGGPGRPLVVLGRLGRLVVLGRLAQADGGREALLLVRARRGGAQRALGARLPGELLPVPGDLEQDANRVGGLRAHGQPVLHPLGIDFDERGLGLRVVLADLLDGAPVALGARIRDDDPVVGLPDLAQALQLNFDSHGCGLLPAN